MTTMLLTTKQACSVLGVKDPRTLKKLVQPVKLGYAVRYDMADLQAVIERAKAASK